MLLGIGARRRRGWGLGGVAFEDYETDNGATALAGFFEHIHFGEFACVLKSDQVPGQHHLIDDVAGFGFEACAELVLVDLTQSLDFDFFDDGGSQALLLCWSGRGLREGLRCDGSAKQE